MTTGFNKNMGSHDLVSDLTEITHFDIARWPWKPANYRPLLGSESDDDFKESSSAHSVKSKLSTKKRLKLAGGSRKSSEAKIADSVQLELPSPLILKPQGILSEDYDCELFSKKSSQQPPSTQGRGIEESSISVPEPDLNAHGLSSQETVLIASSCDSVRSLEEHKNQKLKSSQIVEKAYGRDRALPSDSEDQSVYSDSDSDYNDSAKKKKNVDKKKRKLLSRKSPKVAKKIKYDAKINDKKLTIPSPAIVNLGTRLECPSSSSLDLKDDLSEPAAKTHLAVLKATAFREKLEPSNRKEKLDPVPSNPSPKLFIEETYKVKLKLPREETKMEKSKVTHKESKTGIATSSNEESKTETVELNSETNPKATNRVKQIETIEVVPSFCLLEPSSKGGSLEVLGQVQDTPSAPLEKRHLAKIPRWNPPAQSKSSSKASTNVSPSIGLRLGLSRKGHFKSLHPSNPI